MYAIKNSVEFFPWKILGAIVFLISLFCNFFKSVFVYDFDCSAGK